MTMSTRDHQRLEAEMWRALDSVNDPELDESVTSMGFVERAVVDGQGNIQVDFRLPTYWCSPNFAFLMLDDLRRALGGLSWSPAFSIELHDHMFAEEVNEGLAAGKPFEDIFGELAGDQGLDELRATFAMKAYKRRQEAVLRGLRLEGFTDEEIVGMDVGTLDAVPLGDSEASSQKPRYRSALLSRWAELDPSDPAFPTWEGQSIPADGLNDYLSELRRLRVNMEFSGALCRGLKSARYKEMEMVDGEPTLVDFILDRVPPRQPCETLGAGSGR
ncbi:hypothetical protein HDIA_3871 [Hartmannibacter diazotrophicus]|uniref:MIP18 family-like domain-containing protein n=1 Tax=Hartmannibacter diazotrophicus TaxID=1482074 RepID=A0A2C9DAR2_9HYPH|nr:iron-sulfur cluster assembly protein [Hartmannibacter diazotrophicus]SON57412.1 hypothetical protein HDIA_3871 [Hartmannibacter diazotrophicus]